MQAFTANDWTREHIVKRFPHFFLFTIWTSENHWRFQGVRVSQSTKTVTEVHVWSKAGASEGGGWGKCWAESGIKLKNGI